MSDPDFGRGDGDPLGGPNVANPEPVTPDFSSVLIEFRVSLPRDGVRRVSMTWIDPEGEAEELLLRLWRLWHGETLARLQRDGTGPMDMT